MSEKMCNTCKHAASDPDGGYCTHELSQNKGNIFGLSWRAARRHGAFCGPNGDHWSKMPVERMVELGVLKTPIDVTAFQKEQADRCREAGEEFFMDFPDRWYEDGPMYLCENGHVSRNYLKSEVRGALCLACMKPVGIVDPRDTPPESSFDRLFGSLKRNRAP